MMTTAERAIHEDSGEPGLRCRTDDRSDRIWRRAVLSLTLFAVVLGIFARLDSLDRKVLWRDETFSLLRISGHSENALYALFDGGIHTSREMLALQQVTPLAGLRATLTSLREEPQRGPLYYLLARPWIGVAGNSITAVRGFSVLIGSIGIAIGFFLGRRLTRSTQGGCVLAALIAVSPIEIRFSQQVREYILLADLILLSALLLLRALENPSRLRWFCYAVCSLAGLYTNVTFVCVILGETLVALRIAASASERKRHIAFGSIGAVLGVGLLYAPWAYGASRTAAQHAGDLSWAAGAYSLRSTTLKWIFNTGSVFFDSEYAHVTWGVVLLPVLCIVAVAVMRAFGRGGDVTSRYVALAVTLSTLVPFVALDAERHAHYALVARYEMSTWLGVPMLVTLLLAPGLRSASALSRALAAAALCVLLFAGGVSVFADRPFTQWWDNNDHLSESAVAGVVRAGPHPALIVASIAHAYDTFPLSRYLAPDTPMLLYDDRHVTLPTGYATTYFFTPSRNELARVSALEHAAPRNVSPPPEFAVPELREAAGNTVDAVAYGNSLWESHDATR